MREDFIDNAKVVSGVAAVVLVVAAFGADERDVLRFVTERRITSLAETVGKADGQGFVNGFSADFADMRPFFPYSQEKLCFGAVFHEAFLRPFPDRGYWLPLLI